MNKRSSPHRDPHNYLYRGPRATFVATQQARQMLERRGTGLNWGLSEVDQYIISAMPGFLYVLVGRPGNGKTTTLLHLSRTFERGALDMKGVILYASWEVLVEEFAISRASHLSGVSLFDLTRSGSDVMDRVESALVQEALSPLVLFGRTNAGRGVGHMPTIPDLIEAMRTLQNEGVRVVAVLVDYLQRIPHPYRKSAERREAVAENIQLLKDLAAMFTVPVFVAAQAGREVDQQRGIRHASLRNVQWSSDVEQTADVVVSVTMPGTYLDDGEEISVNGEIFLVQRNMLSFRVLKQRYGPAGRTFLVGVDAATGRLYDDNFVTPY